jgi:hypothetical protein
VEDVDGELSLNSAEHAFHVTQDSDVPDWLLASVHEGLARAYAAKDDVRARDEWYAAASELVDQIHDDESCWLIADHLDGVPGP